jgi:hypothetical protein
MTIEEMEEIVKREELEWEKLSAQEKRDRIVKVRGIWKKMDVGDLKRIGKE